MFMVQRGRNDLDRKYTTLRLPLNVFVLCSIVAGLPTAASTQERGTFLLDSYVGSSRSVLAEGLGSGGYELADATYLDLREWYSSGWRDTTLLLLTQVNSSAGVIWGFSTGERGPKYEIDPAFHAGYVYQYRLTPKFSVTLKATYVLGGDLTEQSCIADFGEIGGVQEVNCRLAAEPIPPGETLQFLAKEPGRNDSRISIMFEYRF